VGRERREGGFVGEHMRGGGDSAGREFSRRKGKRRVGRREGKEGERTITHNEQASSFLIDISPSHSPRALSSRGRPSHSPHRPHLHFPIPAVPPVKGELNTEFVVNFSSCSGTQQFTHPSALQVPGMTLPFFPILPSNPPQREEEKKIRNLQFSCSTKKLYNGRRSLKPTANPKT